MNTAPVTPENNHEFCRQFQAVSDIKDDAEKHAAMCDLIRNWWLYSIKFVIQQRKPGDLQIASGKYR